MSTIYQDVKDFTKIIFCTEDYYRSQNPDGDPYYEYTIFVVNNGSQVDDSSQSYTDMYYGSRKLTDVMIVNEIPLDHSYPNRKLYLVPRTTVVGSQTTVSGYQIYFKYEDIVVPIASDMIASATYNDEGVYPTVSITWNTEESESIATQLLVVDADGSLPEGLITVIVDSVVDRSDREGLFGTTWEHLSTVNKPT